MELVDRLLAGDRRACARLITLVENEAPEAKQALREVYPYTGNAHVIGVTGPPGAGKSSLVDKLTQYYREQGETVGVIAVDPSSPFTGGALLGDRIRMQERATDPGVFIRSMGTRGHMGGLALTTKDVIKILDAFGKDIILVETVGTGQDEIDIIKAADTVLVVTMPSLGDDIQAIKAGILEIGDIFVVNKADLDYVDKAVMELEMMLDFNSDKGWRPPVVRTVANMGVGIEELAEAIQAHIGYLRKEGLFEEKRRLKIEMELLEVLNQLIVKEVLEKAKKTNEFDNLVDLILERETDCYTAAEKLLNPK
ncbi:MAG: methylmalonyl Co-A mutase-associated GTPase MeaB [Theionarchaea archaeon]|nr:methylmalonyl Co-A mutase-associated GTPase MeaB [Theionarchaea archaeon]MBU7001260.1 methylmalonyl Co-A mutase-associated GTPase MeaB [Theionarchaea archaeon]MBU7019869.1 methylmalonyl Co-A mutase-associated GTPase MeaB [Theionarchaea archaeon]MBU7035269.1 methylmalonyl Co-A mutase-associated GTPase MeaB [Theionarchaea archaeon]MBU7040929.1 methylmalonyl Co-A mutase-associated GTPase MeaB [Theionarchaea archaeon]